MYIYKITLMIEAFESIKDNKYTMQIKKLKAEEKTKTYEFWDGRPRKFKKDKMNEPTTIFDENSYKFISYCIYCLDNDIEQSKQKLINLITKKINRRKVALNTLEELFNQGYEIEYKEEE